MRFTVNYRPVAEILAPPRDLNNPIGRGKSKRDGNTLDLLDGRTDLERGPIAALKLETIEAARSLMSADDTLDDLEEKWREDMKNRRVIDPDFSFF